MQGYKDIGTNAPRLSIFYSMRMTIMQSILGDIEKLELCEIFESLGNADICDIIPTDAVEPALVAPHPWMYLKHSIQKMYMADIQHNEFIHHPSPISMIMYDCSGMLSIAEAAFIVPPSIAPDMWAAVTTFIKKCGEARICLFDIGGDDIFVCYSNGDDDALTWQILIKGVGRVIAYDATNADVLAAIMRLDETIAAIKPLEVWAIWFLNHHSISTMSLEVFDKIVDKWGCEKSGVGVWRRSYRALQKCVGMSSDAIIAQFAVPEWICRWGLWPVGIGAPVAT